MSMVMMALVALAASASAPIGLESAAELSGTVRGVDAVRVDPAATAFALGPEAQARVGLPPAAGAAASLGAYLVVPVGALVPSLSYEWLPVDDPSYERFSVGASLRAGRRWAVGASRSGRRVHSAAVSDGSAWNIGVAAQPWSWLSLSAGYDGLATPESSLRAGAAVRPLWGAPWLSAGVEQRWVGREHSVERPRVVLDVGASGLHLLAGYDLEREHLSVGVSATFGGLELRGRENVDAAGDRVGTVLAVSGRRATTDDVDVLAASPAATEVIDGDLRRAPTSLWVGAETVPSLLVRLRQLTEDDDVREVTLVIGALDVGLGTVDELRAEVAALRARGKRVIAEVASMGDKELLLAAAADHIRMDPAGIVNVDGFAVSVSYLAEGLAKLGVRVDSVEVGRYKSGPDPLTRSAPRPEDEEVRRELLGGVATLLDRALTKERKLTAERAAEVFARIALTAKEAFDLGLVDELVEPAPGRKRDASVWPSRVSTFPHSARWGQRPIVVVVPVVGTIVREAADNPLPGPSAEATQIVRWLDDAREDDDVAGVVMRVDSPGGEIYASELIWRAMRRLGEVKPVVVSMGDVAASGGYYVAAPAHVVFASPRTVTGSIGIFQIKFDLAGLYDKLGVHNSVYKTHEHADMQLSTRGVSEAEREEVRRVLAAEYEDFLAKVAQGRGLSVEEVRSRAEGRVYSGERAVELRLVDRIGGLADAVEEVRRRAGLGTDFELQIPTRAVGLVQSVASLVAASGQAQAHPLAALTELQRRLAAWHGQTLALWRGALGDEELR